MSLDTQLRDLLADRLDDLVPPPGDLGDVLRRGSGLRRRRRLATGAAGLAAAAVVLAGGMSVVDHPDDAPRGDRAVDPLGQMDFSHGLRAYADPGHTLHMGGRAVDASGLAFLDTDAVATQEGVVYYSGGDLLLVQEDGTTTTLVDGDPTPDGFHPTAKADAASPLVAYAVVTDDRVAVQVLDMGSRRVVASRVLDCTGACGGLVVEGIDSGAVFVRTEDGTSVWRYADGDRLTPFAGAKTRVADVRNGVVLYDGPVPDGAAAAAWTLVAGAIDAQLTFDGRYVLYWSSRLAPTRAGDDPVTLDQGPVKGLGFWSIDTDGSVLLAAPDAPGGAVHAFTVYDCEVPSGTCEELGPLDPQGGDPMFIGNDM